MKLFLSSQGLPANTSADFLSLFNKPAEHVRIAHIADAAVPYENEDLSWLHSSQSDLVATGVQVDELSLREYEGEQEALRATLKEFDGVWVAGGNCHYLRYWMKASGFDQIIRELLETGFVYAGFSAGVMDIGPSIEHADLDGEPHLEPEIINKGLGLIDFLTLPHWGRKDAEDDAQHQLRDFHMNTSVRTIALMDGEVFIASSGPLRKIGQRLEGARSHEMHLDQKYFDAIASGVKTSELRLNDEKRQELGIGDTIIFSNLENKETLSVTITELTIYPDFTKLGVDMSAYYTTEQVKRYGALKIGVRV